MRHPRSSVVAAAAALPLLLRLLLAPFELGLAPTPSHDRLGVPVVLGEDGPREALLLRDVAVAVLGPSEPDGSRLRELPAARSRPQNFFVVLGVS